MLYNRSHEIRTPLAGVIGSLSLLHESSLDPSQLELVRLSKLCSEQLLSIIDDILDVTKMDENKIRIQRVQFSLHTLMEDALEIASTRAVTAITPAESSSLELLYDLDPSTPDLIWGDPARLRQVLVNLLSNAVKFTQAGSVILSAQVLRRDHATNSHCPVAWIRVSVKDTGIGISEPVQHKLLQPFSQGDDSAARRYVDWESFARGDLIAVFRFSGSGMGLYISKCLMRLMNGELNFYSAGVGHGSTFWITFLAESDEASSVAPSPTVAGADHHVALVDSSVDFLRLTATMIQRWGYSVSCHTSANSENLSELLQRRHNTTQCSAIVVVVKSELIHGADTSMDRIKQSNVHCILVGSNSPSCQLPFPFLRKPLRRNQLQLLLQQCFSAEQRTPPVQQLPVVVSADPATFPPLQVLVAEDTPTNQMIIKRLLSSLGIGNITMVNDGLQAVTAVEHGSYDLILMDVMVINS